MGDRTPATASAESYTVFGIKRHISHTHLYSFKDKPPAAGGEILLQAAHSWAEARAPQTMIVAGTQRRYSSGSQKKERHSRPTGLVPFGKN